MAMDKRKLMIGECEIGTGAHGMGGEMILRTPKKDLNETRERQINGSPLIFIFSFLVSVLVLFFHFFSVSADHIF
jgi:hypothetical protein